MQDFTIRVYGLWINEKEEILLSDERIGSIEFTKFPGGGLEKGEGTKQCLIREWKEELSLDIEVLNHFYTTDFYQASAFDKNVQVLSIYYRVQPKQYVLKDYYKPPKQYSYFGAREEQFRFMSIKKLSAETLSYSIDQYVVKRLKENL